RNTAATDAAITAASDATANIDTKHLPSTCRDLHSAS
ncbi:TPA: prepilin-type cleavage/methylation domain-containing protein, partial [Neisseria meningitidis]